MQGEPGHAVASGFQGHGAALVGLFRGGAPGFRVSVFTGTSCFGGESCGGGSRGQYEQALFKSNNLLGSDGGGFI